MLLRRILIACGLAVALPMAASAARIVFCTTCDPVPTVLTTASLNTFLGTLPANNGSIADEFVNNTGSTLDNFVFSTAINLGLTTGDVSIVNGTDQNPGNDTNSIILDNFNCQQVDTSASGPVGFFLNCSVNYDPTSGLLTFDFFGVNPPETGLAGFLDSFTNEQNEQEGIPNCQVLAICEAAGTAGRGVFTIELQGWTPNLQAGDPTQLYSGTPTITGEFNVPEPSSLLIFLTEFLLLAGCVKLFGRRLNWRRRLDL